MNWDFNDVATFLNQHFFAEVHIRDSHHYYKGLVDGKVRLVEVQYHGSATIKPRTLAHGIIIQSGIPPEIWKAWARAGNRKEQKKVQYKGATPLQKL